MKKLIAAFILLVAVLSVHSYITKAFSGLEGRVEIILNDEYADYVALKAIDSKYEICGMKSAKSDGFNIRLTDESFTTFNKIEMLDGYWLGGANNKIVISKQLAKQIFGDFKGTVGKKIKLGGVEYTVCGVYAPGILHNAVQEQKNIVYAPLGSALNSAAFDVDTLMIKPSQGKATAIFAKLVSDYLKNQGINVENCTINDFTDVNKLINQYWDVNFFVVKCILLILIVGLLISIGKYCIFRYGEKLNNGYAGEILSDNLVIILALCIFFIFLLFLVAFLARDIIEFKFYIPPKYLPPTYIFDMSFYKNLTIDTGLTGVSDFGIIYRLVNKVLLGIFGVELALNILVSKLLCKCVANKIFSRVKPYKMKAGDIN